MELDGCSSHACLVKKPDGMGTNSGKCYCPEWKIRVVIYKLQKRIRELEEKNDPQ